MDIKEVVKTKKDLEGSILEAVKSFTEKTGAVVDDIVLVKHEYVDAFGVVKCFDYDANVVVKI